MRKTFCRLVGMGALCAGSFLAAQEDLPMPGGWTDFNVLVEPEAKEVFKQATSQLMGVDYKLLACATQVVAGANYAFLCTAAVVAPNAPKAILTLYVHKPLPGQGGLKLMGIQKLKASMPQMEK